MNEVNPKTTQSLAIDSGKLDPLKDTLKMPSALSAGSPNVMPHRSSMRFSDSLSNAPDPNLPVLVFCQGFGGYNEKYQALLEQAAAHGWSAITFEWPGQGRDYPLEHPTCAHLAGDIQPFFDRLNAVIQEIPAQRPVILVATSMAALVVMTWFNTASVQLTQRVKGMVMCGPFVEYASLKRRFWARIFRFTPRFLWRQTLPNFARSKPRKYHTTATTRSEMFRRNTQVACRAQYDKLLSLDAAYPNYVRKTMSLGWVRAIAKAVAHLRRMRRTGKLRHLPPSLWLIGDEERVVNVAAVQDYAKACDGQLKVYTTCRHLLLLNSQETQIQFFQDLAIWVKKCLGTQAPETG